MELTWIEDFLALERLRNFTRAAEARCTTQSAYSRRIQTLENWLGVALIDREARPLRLTKAGEEFLLRAKKMREEMLDARRAALSASSHFKKTQRIYTTNTLATNFLPDWVAANKPERYSLIVASISGCLEAIRQKRADLALVPRFNKEDTAGFLDVAIIGEDRLVPVANEGNSIRLEKNALVGPLMVYAPGTAYGAQIDRMLKKHGLIIRDEPICESASAEALFAQTRAGLGAAWIPSMLLSKEFRRCKVPNYLDVPYEIALIKA